MLQRAGRVCMCFVWLLLGGLLGLALNVPVRFHQGFSAPHFLPLLIYPLFAALAGRWWYNPPLFMSYGMVGIASMLPNFLDYRNQSPTPHLGYDILDMLLWLVAILGGGLLCRWLGSLTQRRPRHVSTVPPLLSEVADDHTNSGQRMN